LTHFSKMMQMANARYDPILSEKTVEGLFQNGIIKVDDYKNFENIEFAKNKLKTALLEPVYGAATQDAAIAAVYTLGKEHAILRNPAIEGLSSVRNYMIKIKGEKDEKVLKIDKFLNDLEFLK